VQAASDPSVRLVDPAILPIQPSQPKPLLYVILAIIAGTFAGVAAALTRQYFDRAVHGSAEMRLATGLPVLGVIPSISGATKRESRRAGSGKSFKALMDATADDGAAAPLSDALPSEAGAASTGQMVAGQAFERLQTNIRFIRPDTGVKTLLVTSPLPGDGKTTTAVNLALSLAQSGYVTTLVDGDLRRGLVASMFDVQRAPGLSELLRGFSKLEDVLKSVAVGEGGLLYYLTSGTLPPNPTRLLESDALRLLIADLASRCDVVVIDSPPLNAVHDAALLASVSDGVILVARAGVTTIEAIGYAMDQLRTVHAPLLGTVLNDADLRRDTAYGGGYAYRWQDADAGAGAVGTR
jgi:capsular exopolysaccharide synthesis family protein